LSALKPLALKNTFKKRLEPFYSVGEIYSFFEILVEKTDGLSRSDIIVNRIDLDPDVYEQAIKRLEAREPIQYIVGETIFYNLPFKTDKRALIPRPETEELVDWIVQENANTPLKILDIGTGSGCIAVSLARALKQAYISAIDVSNEALTLAHTNAIQNGVSIDFQHVDILKKDVDEFYDLVVSNPPYISYEELESMDETVTAFEPHLALFSQDPLAFYNRILQIFLKNTTVIYFEINNRFVSELTALLELKSCSFEFKSDVNNNVRFLKVWLTR
jgi:release factor glutamine methyltransferase